MPLKSNVSKWRLHLQAAVLSLHSNLCALANTLTGTFAFRVGNRGFSRGSASQRPYQ